jgi:hypothetical protein
MDEFEFSLSAFYARQTMVLSMARAINEEECPYLQPFPAVSRVNARWCAEDCQRHAELTLKPRLSDDCNSSFQPSMS